MSNSSNTRINRASLALVALGMALAGCADPVSPKADRISEQIAMAPNADPLVLFPFDDPKTVDPWRIINDTVMGGRSSSRMQPTADGTAVFEGVVSLESNGGFAHTRSMAAPYDLSAYAGIALRVRGDGKRYKLTLKLDRSFDGTMYQADFVTEKDAWQEVRLPFTAFTPTYHGRILTDKPPLDASKIATIGFMIADKQSGPFRLEIDWLGAYKAK